MKKEHIGKSCNIKDIDIENNANKKENADTTGQKDYLDSLTDKLEALGLADESYVNQMCECLEPVLGETDDNYGNQEGNRLDGCYVNHAKTSGGCRKRKGETAFYKDPIVWLILLFLGTAMSVILKSGFYTDDIILSYQSKYFIWDTGTDLRTYLGVVIQSWLEQGRFFPVSNIYVSLFMHYISSPFVYKLWILFFVIINVYVFGAFVRRLTGSRSFSLLAMAVLPVCFQIRAYHDALIAYHLLMQVVLLLLLFAAMALLQFLKTKKRIWLAGSLVPYTLGLLTYEAAYVSIFLLFFLVFFYEAETVRKAFGRASLKRTFFTILPYFLVMVVLFFLSVHVKNIYGLSYEGIQPEFLPGKVLLTTGKQALAALPFSHHFLCNDGLGHIFHNNPVDIIRTAKIQDYIAAIFLIVLSFWLLKKTWKVKNVWCLFGIGLSLLFVPALLIGVSARYQKELIWGIGHIPVYLEYFGITLLGMLLAGWLLNRLKKEKLRRLGTVFCSLVLGLGLLVQIQDNRAVIAVMNNVYWYPQKILDKSIDAGIFENLEDGSILIVENEPLYLGYPGKEYFSYKTGKRLEVYRMEEFLEQAYPENTPVYVLSYEADRYRQELTLKEASYHGELTVKSISKLCLLGPETAE